MTWDPDQPRDPDGQWSDGMPNIVAAVNFSLGGQPAVMRSERGDKVTFEVGGATVKADRKYFLEGLGSALRAGDGSQEVLDESYNEKLRLRFGDYVEDQGSAASLEFVGQDVTVDLSAQDLKTLATNADRTLVAQRLDMPSGPVDVFLGDRTFGFRTKIQGSDPVSYEFDEKSFKALRSAENVVEEGFDEDGSYGPEGALVDELTVKTNAGTFTVSRDEPYTDGSTGPVNITIGPIDRDDFFITHTTDAADPWYGAVSDLEDVADLEGFYRRSAAAAAARRVPGGTLMRASERKTMHRAFGYVDRTALRDGVPLRVVMASEGRMADNIDLRMSGADLARFRSNPVLGYGHSYWGRENLPIGRVSPESLAVDGQLLAGDLEFDEDDDFAQLVERKMRGKFLNAVSIGFEVLQWESAEDSYWRGGVATKWELTELSVVPVPMDASAVVTAGRGLDLADPGLLAEVGKYSEQDFARLIRRLRALDGVLKPAEPEPEPDTTTTPPSAEPAVAPIAARGLLDAFTITKESHHV